MSEGSIVRSNILALQKSNALVHAKGGMKFDFMTIDKGHDFRVRGRWRFIDFESPAYIVSFSNSYQQHVVKAELDYRPTYVSSIYLGGYIELKKNIPDSIIQPKNLANRVLDFFFHYNVEVNHHDFDKKYLLQSVDKETIVDLLGADLIHTIATKEDLYVEIKNNKCLIYFLHSVKENDGLILFDVLKSFVNLDRQ